MFVIRINWVLCLITCASLIFCIPLRLDAQERTGIQTNVVINAKCKPSRSYWLAPFAHAEIVILGRSQDHCNLLYGEYTPGSRIPLTSTNANRLVCRVPSNIEEVRVPTTTEGIDLRQLLPFCKAQCPSASKDSVKQNGEVSKHPEMTFRNVAILSNPKLAADMDGDMQVNCHDLFMTIACFSGPGCGLPVSCQYGQRADFDRDGDVDLSDLTKFHLLLGPELGICLEQ